MGETSCFIVEGACIYSSIVSEAATKSLLPLPPAKGFRGKMGKNPLPFYKIRLQDSRLVAAYECVFVWAQFKGPLIYMSNNGTTTEPRNVVEPLSTDIKYIAIVDGGRGGHAPGKGRHYFLVFRMSAQAFFVPTSFPIQRCFYA